MPAKSKQQQKFMGIVRSIQKGEEPASKFSKAAQDAAEDMKQKDVEDFASTKHKGLPKKVEQYLRKKIRKEITKMIKEDWFDRLSPEDQKKYVKAHPGSKKAKQAAHDKEREKRARKIRSKNYTVDADGNIVKVKKTKEDPKKHAKHMAAIKKGYFPGDSEYDEFMKEDYVETCGYTQSVDGKKLKTPGATGEEDRHLKEAKRITRGNRGVKVGDTVKFYDRDRNPAHYRGKVKWIMKAKKNKEFVDFIYITAKGNYTDQHLQGTKAYKWHYRRREGVNENLRPSDRRVLMVVGRDFVQWMNSQFKNGLGKKEIRGLKQTLPNMLSVLGRPEDKRYNKFKSSMKHTPIRKYNDKLLARLSKGFDSEPTNIKRKFVDKLIKYSLKESVNEVNVVPLKHYIGWFKKDAKKAKVTPLEYTKYQIRYPGFYGLDKKTLKALLKYFQKNESVNEARLDAPQLLKQLGGNRFVMMVGAKNLAVDKSKNELHMKIMRNAKGVSHVIIKLNPKDLYDMKFLQVRAGKIKIKSKVKDVYADQLGKMFKKHTGLNVRL